MNRCLRWNVSYRLLAAYIMVTYILAGGTIDVFTSSVKNQFIVDHVCALKENVLFDVEILPYNTRKCRIHKTI
jgi:hypothetical protein